jgi:hypothetical protein
MNGLLVFLEKLFFYDYEKAVNEIKLEIKHKKLKSHDTLIGIILMEVVPPVEIDNFIQNIYEIKSFAKNEGLKSFKLILIPAYKTYDHLLRDFDVEYFDSLANLTYNSYVKRSELKSDRWNYNSDKFLMLTGIPVRYHRIRLVHKFYKENLLDRSIWSLFPPLSDNNKKDCRRILNDIDDEEYLKFSTVGFKKIDNIITDSHNDVIRAQYNDLTIEIPSSLFQKTLFSVISETYFLSDHPNYDISEKTWRAIINRHPFIIAGTTGISKYLQSMGFKNFINYFPIDHDSIIDKESRLDSIIENTKFLLNEIDKYKEDIETDVEHNYQTFVSMVHNQKQYFQQFFESYHIHQDDIDLVLNNTNYWKLAKDDFWNNLADKQKQNDTKN